MERYGANTHQGQVLEKQRDEDNTFVTMMLALPLDRLLLTLEFSSSVPEIPAIHIYGAMQDDLIFT